MASDAVACGQGKTRSLSIYWLVSLLLLSHLGLVCWSAWRQGPVYNEAGHLSAGLSHLCFGRFDLFRVNPPLIRTVAACPLRLASVSTNWEHYDHDPLKRAEHAVGLDFLYANGARSLWLVTLARWACIPFVLLGAYTCFLWARDLYGTAAGMLALSLWCFSPTIRGHSSLITPDAHAAAVALAAGYAFWLWLRQPQWSQALITGLLLGLAELSKFTLVVLYPVWILVWLWYGLSDRANAARPGLMHQTRMFAAIVFVSLYVINTGYLFEGSFKRLGEYRFQTMALTGADSLADVPSKGANRFAETWLGRLPVPLPSNYVQGIDTQKLYFERGMRSYLRGKWRDRGWWHYYLYALLIKVPVGTSLLALLATALTLLDRRYSVPWRDEVALLLPSAAILALVSSQPGFSAHSRYALPALPFLFVWTSRVARAFQLGHPAMGRVVAVAATWVVVSSLWTYPHDLSYFNELVGGPRRGHAHLLDSNISWGQDVRYLKRWISAHREASPLYLVYYGQVDPRLLGIEFTLPPTGAVSSHRTEGRFDEANLPLPGWYGIDVNHLQGTDRPAADGKGGWVCFPGPRFRPFQQFEPVAMAGYSIYIYHITTDDANRVRRGLGLSELKPEDAVDASQPGREGQ